MSVTKRVGLSKLIPLSLLSEPPHPQRIEMDDQNMADLAQSIREVGLIEPLIVEPVNDRYVVRVGHRRLLACRIANSDPVPCIVRDPATYDAEAVMLHENIFREKLNPAEEAVWYDELLERRCEGDTDRLVALLHRDRTIVESRLNLLKGYEVVFEALQRRQINMSVAQELNKIQPESAMAVFLDAAKRGGARARQVREWRLEHDRRHGNERDPAEIAASVNEELAAQTSELFRCVYCGHADDHYQLEMLYIHSYCRKVMEKQAVRPPGALDDSRDSPTDRPVKTVARS